MIESGSDVTEVGVGGVSIAEANRGVGRVTRRDADAPPGKSSPAFEKQRVVSTTGGGTPVGFGHSANKLPRHDEEGPTVHSLPDIVPWN